MDEIVAGLFFALLRSAVRNEPLSEADKSLISDSRIKNMLVIAKKQDVSVMLAHALDKNKCPCEDAELKKALGKEVMTAVYRYKQLNYELLRVCGVLNENKIYHIPLKGSVLRNYYPSPWLRTSCDIDVLVAPSDLARAREILEKELNYVMDDVGTHDYSFFSRSNVHLELHFDLNEPKSESYELLCRVWEYAHPIKENSYTLEINDEVFYFYHVAHMAKHFLNGGCGIRPILDLWIMDNLISGDVSERDRVLTEGNLLTFANAARALSDVWMSGAPHSEISLKMQNYLLSGGVYGNVENMVQIQQTKSGGKMKFLLSKVFLPYEKIKYYYPVLQKHKWLTPFMQVHRWFKIIFCGGVGRSVRTLQANGSVESTEQKETARFLSQIGL